MCSSIVVEVTHSLRSPCIWNHCRQTTSKSTASTSTAGMESAGGTSATSMGTSRPLTLVATSIAPAQSSQWNLENDLSPSAFWAITPNEKKPFDVPGSIIRDEEQVKNNQKDLYPTRVLLELRTPVEAGYSSRRGRSCRRMEQWLLRVRRGGPVQHTVRGGQTKPHR